MTKLLDVEIPRTLDTLVREHGQAGTWLEAWVFEDEPARRAAEAQLAASGVEARLRSAYKPLLHFFLEEVELSGLSAVTIRTPAHRLAAPNRFRLEAYPLAGLLRGVPVHFEPGAEELHYIVRLEHGARRTEHRVFAPNRKRRSHLGEDALSPCGWLRRGGHSTEDGPLETEYELAFGAVMKALVDHGWNEKPPFFEVLEILVETGGIEHRLFYGDECLSTREALHEDLYFSGLEFFQNRKGLPAGDRTLRLGQIVPDIRACSGPTRVRLTLRPGDGASAHPDGAQSLETADHPLDPAQIETELAALGGARFDASSRQGRPVFAAHVDGRGPGLVISAGQHANETSGVVGALRATAVLKERGIGFALIPQENPDGYALHGLLRQHNPRHMHHAARFTALGDDLAFRESEPYRETEAHLEAYRRTDAVLHINLHGYPAHEWSRPHTGYVPRGSGMWMTPQGFFLILRHRPGLRDAAERFVRKLAASVSRLPGLREFNEAHLATYKAHAGDLPFPVYDSVPCNIGEHARSAPAFMLVTEYPDETIYGDAFRLAHTVQMTTVIEAAELLAGGELQPG